LKGKREAGRSPVERAHFVVEDKGQGLEAEERRRFEEERWLQEGIALRRAAEELTQQRAKLEAAALKDLAKLGGDDSFQLISESLDSPSAEIRNAAVRALYDLNPDRAASFFNRALREGGPDRRRRIGAALAGSGLAGDAINSLTGESHQDTYGAFSLLFLVAKAGEVQPLMRIIETHPSIDLRLAVIKLLTLSGEPGVGPAFRRLASRSLLPSEVRSAVMDAIYQITRARESDSSL
jgi:HEAT repeat protein